MISVKEFLFEKGLKPNMLDNKVNMKELQRLLYDYAKMVREEQIIMCAATSASYTSKKVRGVPERIDDDFKAHMVVPRVDIGNRFPDDN